MEFTVIIKETLEKEIKVNTDDKVSAVIIAEKMYKNEEVVLTADDFSNVTIDVK